MDFISNLATKRVTKLEGFRNLWFNLLKEMVESGKVTKFERDVVELEGLKSKKEVLRVGSFNLLSEGKYLRYDNASDEVYELGRQPHSHFLSYVEDFTYSDEKEVLPLAVDFLEAQSCQLLCKRQVCLRGLSRVGWLVM